MLNLEEQQARRKEIIQELKEMNKESRSYLEKLEQNDVALKAIEGRVKGFFRNGKFNRSLFENYLLELRDITKTNGLYEMPQTAIYDEKTGERLDDAKYAVKNLYVEYAIKVCNKLQHDFNNRKGVDEELGHYQRNVRKGLSGLKGKLKTDHRGKILKLYPHLLYKKQLDISQIGDILKIQRPTATKLMKLLISEECGKIMIGQKVGKKMLYSFNPKYIFSGAGGKKDEHDVKVYVDFLLQVIESVEKIEDELAQELGVKKLSHSALALLHALIPYFHYQTFYAVTNPTEPITLEVETVWEAKERELDNNEDTILEFISKRELARNISKGTTDLNYIDRDLYVLERAEAIIYTSNTILINPKLMFAMDDSLNNENDLYVKSVLMKFKDEKDARNQFAKKGQDPKKTLLVKEKSNKKTKEEN